MSKPLTIDRAAVAELCRRFPVHRLTVFGSAATGDFDHSSSDIDLLVEFEDGAPGLFDAYFDLKDALEALFGRPVDLVTAKALENPYFAAAVEATRVDLYAA